MLDLAPGIYRQPRNWPDRKSFPGTQRDFLAVRFTVRLKRIPAIDLDRHRGRHLPQESTRLAQLSIDLDRSRSIENYSHSIINEHSKLLIRKALSAAPQVFTVIFTVKVRSTSIGAGLRAIRPEATFRDLSTSIDSHDHRRHRQRPSVPDRESLQGGWHRIA